jgi:aryl-alcohol dehydrogenase-like predicted oxidoreductase
MKAPTPFPEDFRSRREFLRQTTLAAAGLAVSAKCIAASESPSKPVNYTADMEYRPLGRTGLMISAVCLGGHWKRIDTVVSTAGGIDAPDFRKNRYDVVSRCMERGINYIDACTSSEIIVYSRALKGRRDQMHLGFSWSEDEMRNDAFRRTDKLLATLEKGMKEAGLDYVDLWRITMNEQSGQHASPEVDEMMKALDTAKKQGKARFAGFSSHDRKHIKSMIETYPAVVDVIVTPYTAKSKVLPADSVFEALKEHHVGMFGIKPFASNSLFKGTSAQNDPSAAEDDRRARMALRNILCNPAVTAPIPGMINLHQVDNAADAVKERRQLDAAEKAELDRAATEMWARLPTDYQWLKDWEYV